jgi:hypothetical protein
MHDCCRSRKGFGLEERHGINDTTTIREGFFRANFRTVDPLESLHLQLKEEVEAYERLKRGEFEELDNFRGLGHLLITSRIAQGISQGELARRLGVHETQVSRDERNEYVGITLERAATILDALNVRLGPRLRSNRCRRSP